MRPYLRLAAFTLFCIAVLYFILCYTFNRVAGMFGWVAGGAAILLFAFLFQGWATVGGYLAQGANTLGDYLSRGVNASSASISAWWHRSGQQGAVDLLTRAKSNPMATLAILLYLACVIAAFLATTHERHATEWSQWAVACGVLGTGAILVHYHGMQFFRENWKWVFLTVSAFLLLSSVLFGWQIRAIIVFATLTLIAIITAVDGAWTWIGQEIPKTLFGGHGKWMAAFSWGAIFLTLALMFAFTPYPYRTLLRVGDFRVSYATMVMIFAPLAVFCIFLVLFPSKAYDEAYAKKEKELLSK